MMLVVTGPAGLGAPALEAGPDPVAGRLDVARPATVAVRGTTPEGTTRLVEADAIEARALLHELDHLDGLLFSTGWCRRPPTCSGAGATVRT